MRSAYVPASSLDAGKRYRPSRSVTTVVVMVDAAFFALTSTPSIGPSSAEETRPVSAAPATAGAGWARRGRRPAGDSARAAPTTERSRTYLDRMWPSAGISDFRGQISDWGLSH